MLLCRPLLAAVMVAGLALPARANITVYYHAGVWEAFDGQGDDGQTVCGIGSRNPSDGSAFSVRFVIGGDDVTFTAVKPSWDIPDHTQIPVVMQVGLEQPWSEQAIGSGNRVQWIVSQADVQSFDEQFRRSSSMTVTFPAGSERPWTISLAGSTAASNAMGRCVTDLTQRAAAAQQPAAAAPAAAPNATQPFGTAPAAPGNPAQTQPVTQDQPTQPATQGQQTQPNAAPSTQPNPSH